MTATHSEKVGRCFRNASMKGMRFLNFSQDFGSGFYPERVEFTSTESTSLYSFTFLPPDHCWVNVKLPQLKFAVSKTTRMVMGPLGKATGLTDGIRRKTDQSFKGELIPVEDREPRFVPMGYSK